MYIDSEESIQVPKIEKFSSCLNCGAKTIRKNVHNGNLCYIRFDCTNLLCSVDHFRVFCVHGGSIRGYEVKYESSMKKMV